MKARATLRVGTDAVGCLIDQLNAISDAIVKSAEANAKQACRTTIMATDVTAAMAAVTGSTQNLPFLFKQLETLSAKDTADISDLIQKWIDTH